MNGLLVVLKMGVPYVVIEELLLDLCEQNVPDPYRDPCTGFVRQYIPQIAEWAKEANMTGRKICSRMGICAIRPKFVRKAVIRADFCSICKDIVHFVEQLVLEQVAEEEIVKLVNGVCRELAPPISDYCMKTLDGLVDVVIKWIERGIDALSICSKLGLCVAKRTA
jgi:hypothetical protein